MTQYPLNLPLTTIYRREDFIPSGCNREALMFIDRWPDWPDMGLILYGPPSCGKTHLAALWAQRADALVLTPEQIGSAPSAELLQNRRAVLLEDADRTDDENAFFHLLNHLREQKTSLLMTAPTPPATWPVTLADLRSRLLALPTCAILSPDEALLAAVMRKQFADRQLLVADDVPFYLLTRMERSFAAATALVATLDHAALAQQRAITLPLVRKVLEETGIVS